MTWTIPTAAAALAARPAVRAAELLQGGRLAAPQAAGHALPAAEDPLESPPPPPDPELPPTRAGRVQCPCGRWVRPDMLTDLRSAPEEARRAAVVRFRAGSVLGWACDACLETTERTGRIDRAALFAGLGAPAEVQQRVRTRRAAREERRAAERGEPRPRGKS